MSTDVTTVLSGALLDALGRAGLPAVPPSEVAWEVPRDPTHGDYATNVAMLLAKSHRRPPRQVAETILAHLPGVDEIERAEVAGPGFLNVFLSPAYCRAGLARILSEGERFGHQTEGQGQRAMVEFVSANPTGPLTLGHGRQGILGDCVARLFGAMGYETTREYYFNNAGRQMRVLGESVRARYLELLGRPATFPEDGYQGDYIREIAAELRDRHGESLAGDGHEAVFRQAAEDGIFADIRRTLERLGIRFDVYSNEDAALHRGQDRGDARGAPRGGARLREGRRDVAPVLRHRPPPGPRDREVLRRADVPAPGHRVSPREARAGASISSSNVQGADHIEEGKDVVAAIGALGLPSDRIRYLIHQFVTITRGGVEVKMSTRRATYVTIDDLLDQVGQRRRVPLVHGDAEPAEPPELRPRRGDGAGLAEEPGVLRPVRPRAGRERLQPRAGARGRRADGLDRGRPRAARRRPRSWPS